MKERITALASALINRYRSHLPGAAFTIAISGIDAAGKGYISELLRDELEARGYRVALIHTDPWQNPLGIRLKKENAAENVYEHIFRWDDLFQQLIFPLRNNKGILLETKGIRSAADIYYPLVYNYNDIDILLIEGILLLKKKYLSYYDYKIWIDCSFETGISRAIERNAESLDAPALIHDYHTFYYPAQRFHFEKDGPREQADLVFENN